MLKRAKLIILIIGFLFAGAFSIAENSLDGERLDLELRMQKRVEDALGKILPAGQFVVVVRVEPLQNEKLVKPESGGDGQAYYLPGVPARNTFDEAGNKLDALVESLKPEPKVFQHFIKRVYVTLVLDQNLPDETVSKVRELTRQMVGLDPTRGDALDIQRTVFSKSLESQEAAPTAISKLQKEVREYWILIILVLIVLCVGIFILFMFGPLRGFLNNFVKILPTLKATDSFDRGGGRMDYGMFPPMMNPYGLPPPAASAGAPAGFTGSLQVENPNKVTLPFGFIREDNLSNLAILLSRETPEKAAVVLGYMPPEWISRVMARLDSTMQSDIATHLATTRQLLPEQVEDIEQDLRRRLDYLIGGPERLFAIYDSLDPEGQRSMLDNLRTSRPEVVDILRQKTFMFEDLERLDDGALKSVLREVDLQTVVSSLKGMGEEFVKKILDHMSEGKAQIVKEEISLNEGVIGKSTIEAQKKIIKIAKRMEHEGQIQIPQVEEAAPSSRFGIPSLRSTIKLPPGFNPENVLPAEQLSTKGPSGEVSVEEKIKRFLNKKTTDADEFDLPSSTGTGE